ncbi:MAG: Fe-S cluster assembly ATPase SufC [Planctomycetes bacterium]|nr:Fe-S cluster assembly ATPase SufC [Planctomycetota bacterium]
MGALLEIKDLFVEIDGKRILNGLTLSVNKGELHAIMGPNGSGKSTLASALLGHPKYKITSGDVIFDGKSLKGLSSDAIARTGLFLAFQYPVAVPGVSIASFLRLAYLQRHGIDPSKSISATGQSPAQQQQQNEVVQMSVREFLKKLKAKLGELGLDQSFISRYVNDGFSGGEKKRLEILQLSVLEPGFAVLDETDSGLDIDALKVVSNGINSMRSPERGFLVITHYQRILDYLKPDVVHVLMNGKIVTSGGPEFAFELEKRGYDWAREQFVKN